jgi:hypothetical protein
MSGSRLPLPVPLAGISVPNLFFRDSVARWNDLTEVASLERRTYASHLRLGMDLGTLSLSTTSQMAISWDDVEVLMGGPGYRERFYSGALFFGSLSVSLAGMLAAMPKSVTKWEDDFIEKAGRNLSRAYTEPPVWDGDHWFHNYVGHPYGGSLYYNAIRSQGGNITESFLFSALASTTWEYVIEAVAEQPSIQDLFITPIFGSLLGELFHYATMSMLADGLTAMESVLVTVINPLYVFNNGYR